MVHFFFGIEHIQREERPALYQVSRQAMGFGLQMAPVTRRNAYLGAVVRIEWCPRIFYTSRRAVRTPDGAAIGIEGLGLQALELEVLELGLNSADQN